MKPVQSGRLREKENLSLAERFLRQIYHLVFRFTRSMTLGVRALVINEKNEIYLVRHTYVHGWYLPGGGVEVGETIYQAIAKELWEEGNIVLNSSPTLSGVFLNSGTTKRDHVVCFIVRDWEQEAPFTPNLEIAEGRMFPIDDLPDGITPSTKSRIDEYLRGKTLSHIW